MNLFDIILVSCGAKELTKACVQSIIEWTDPNQAKLYWLDNKPEESAVCDIEESDLWTMYIPMEENIGYTKAVNAMVAISSSPFIVLLNDDTEVTGGWLKRMHEAFSDIAMLGAVGPATDNEHCPQGKIGRNQGPIIMRPTLHKGSGWATVHLSGFCCMIPREVWQNVGYLDDNLSPVMGEDDDWFYRAYLQGYKLAIQTDALVRHRAKGTMDMLGGRSELQQRNLKYLVKKHAETLHLLNVH